MKKMKYFFSQLKNLKSFFIFVFTLSLLIYFFQSFENRDLIPNIQFYNKKWRYEMTKSNYKIIMLWTPFYGIKNYTSNLKLLGCPYSNCKFIWDKTLIGFSDAIIIHLRDFKPHIMPKRIHSQQVWILLNGESPVHSPKNIHHLNGKINWTITYRQDSDIVLQPYLINRTNPFILKKNYSVNKSKPIVWFVSNCNTPGKREKYVKMLKKLINVDVYGKCGNMTCEPKMSQFCYQNILKNYYFYLSFENSLCPDYVTEKFFNVLNYDIVPVVFGGANYSLFAPSYSYIDALSFKLPLQLAQYLTYLMNNPKEYNRYFEWKNFFQFQGRIWECQICQNLHKSIKSKVWENLTKWWFDEAPCKAWTPKKLTTSVYLYP